MKQVKDVKGLDWDVGAIGNAEWTGTWHLILCFGGHKLMAGWGRTGVPLRDVLSYAGLSNEAEGNLPPTVSALLTSSFLLPAWPSGLKHVQFEGLDCDIVQCYGASIPLPKALDPRVRYSHLLLLSEKKEQGLIQGNNRET